MHSKLELLFEKYKPEISTPQELFVLQIHSILVDNNLHCIGLRGQLEANKVSDLLPSGWNNSLPFDLYYRHHCDDCTHLTERCKNEIFHLIITFSVGYAFIQLLYHEIVIDTISLKISLYIQDTAENTSEIFYNQENCAKIFQKYFFRKIKRKASDTNIKLPKNKKSNVTSKPGGSMAETFSSSSNSCCHHPCHTDISGLPYVTNHSFNFKLSDLQSTLSTINFDTSSGIIVKSCIPAEKPSEPVEGPSEPVEKPSDSPQVSQQGLFLEQEFRRCQKEQAEKELVKIERDRQSRERKEAEASESGWENQQEQQKEYAGEEVQTISPIAVKSYSHTPAPPSAVSEKEEVRRLEQEKKRESDHTHISASKMPEEYSIPPESTSNKSAVSQKSIFDESSERSAESLIPAHPKAPDEHSFQPENINSARVLTQNSIGIQVQESVSTKNSTAIIVVRRVEKVKKLEMDESQSIIKMDFFE